VAPASPFECASGMQQRTYLMHRALCRHGDVDVVILEAGERVTATHDGRAVEATTVERLDLGRFAPNPQLTAAVESAFGRSLGDYDLVLGRYLWPLTQLVVPPHVPIIGDLDDFHYRYGAGGPTSFKVLRERLRKAASHRLARRQLRRLRAAFFASVRDQVEEQIESRLLPNVPLHIVPNPAFDTGGERILFVGSLWYRPNRDGVNWFLRGAWPAITRAYPRATLRLIGAAAPEVRARWTHDQRVEAPGFVDDIAAEYASATLVIAPVHSGGGSNIKIIEALAHGRPCLTTHFCASAFNAFVPGRDFVAADTQQEFARACIELLADAPRRNAIARSGHRQVSTHYTVDRFHATVREMLDELFAAPNPRLASSAA